MVLHLRCRSLLGEGGSPVSSPARPSPTLPSFSILTPSRNQRTFLEVCVASVVVQGYPAVEQIVADGGSTDGTAAYLASSPGRVRRWRSEEDGGQSEALNWALAQATGEWIGWQNADDFYVPGALWRVARAIAANPEVRVVVGDVALVDGQGVVLGTVGVAPVPARRWVEGFWPYNQGVFVHASVAAAVGPLDVTLRLHMDTDWLARIARLDPCVAYLDATLGAFRKHGAAKTIGGADEPGSRDERAHLEQRYGRRLWPANPRARVVHRLRTHWARLRHFGLAALVRRAGQWAERRDVVRVVR